MPLTFELKASYEAVLQDMETERLQVQQQLSSLQTRIKEINLSISTLSKRLSPDAPLFRSLAQSRQNLRYVNMSLRWAILDLLGDSEGMTTSEIADTLKEKGIQTKAVVFANNVSSVLTTTMKVKHQEVQQLPDGKWQLNENGKNAITHIRTTPKFRRSCTWS
jgi:hypothetical protein